MATEKKLDCVILGLLSHEELTGYEIKKRIDTSLSYFWGASYGSIYPTLSALTKQMYVTKRETMEHGRRKCYYQITEDGKEVLHTWLKAPVEKDELRYETLLKLFFGKEAGPSQTLAHIEAFQQNIEQKLPYLLMAEQTLKCIVTEDETHLYYLLTVMFGIKTYQSYLAWCEEASSMLRKER